MKLPAGGLKTVVLLLGIDAIEQRPTLVSDPFVENSLAGVSFLEKGPFRSRMISPPVVVQLENADRALSVSE